MNVLLLHGPNLNLLGEREPAVYGSTTLAELNADLTKEAAQMQINLQIHQTNAESTLLDLLHAERRRADFIIINPGALTHTSIALRDAFLAIQRPFIEVHLSNIYAREPFRHHSYLADIALGNINGLGCYGYHLALKAAQHYLHSSTRGN